MVRSLGGHASGDDKPVSQGRTLSVLVSEDARFQLEFCLSPDFRATPAHTVMLERHGDFAIWSAGLYHRWT